MVSSVEQGDLQKNFCWVSKIRQLSGGLLEAQVRKQDLFYPCYLENRSSLHIVRYEDVANNPDMYSQLLDHPIENPVTVKNQNRNPRYDMSEVNRLWEYVAQYTPTSCSLYPKLDGY